MPGTERLEAAQQASRGRWQGLAAAFVVVALLVGLLLYGRHSVHISNILRVRAQLRASEALAVASAQLVDEQARSLAHEVGIAARSAGLASGLRSRNKHAVARELAALTASGSTVSQAAAYTSDGVLVASVGSAVQSKLLAEERRTARARGAGQGTRIVSLPDGRAAAVLLAPVGTSARPMGYLIGARPVVGPEGSPLQRAAAGAGHAFYVLDRAGDASAVWGDPDQRAASDAPIAAMAEAASGGTAGTTVVFTDDVLRRRLVAYAPLPHTGQVLVTSHLAEHALRPSRYLVARLFNMAVPTIALVSVAGWALLAYYYRERQLARTLAAANVRLDAEARAGSDLLANVSHDLRTPLAAMRLAIGGLLDPAVPWDAASARETLHTARAQLDRLSAKVRNLLVMARLESGRQSLRADLGDLTDIVDGAMAQLRPLLAGREVCTQFPEQPIMIRCDQAQVETVIVNLIENALKYSPEGSPIELAGGADGPWARCTVRDHGPGVPTGSEEKLFTKFYRGDHTAHVGGAGLGLAICKSIVEAHQGRIGVRNMPDGGAQFWFELPLPLIEMPGSATMEVAH